MSIFYDKKMLIMLLTSAVLTFGITNKSYAVARVLEYDFDVNGSWEYDVDQDLDWEKDEWSESGSRDIDCNVTYTVVEDNGDSSYDIDIDQDNGTITIDNGSPNNMSTGSDTMIQEDGRGKFIHELDYDLLLPDLDGDEWYQGTRSDSTGPFISIAVDVNDTWTHTIYVTPYGEEQQTVNINCKLLEWTTLNGYNVGKIERTYTYPIHCVKKSDSNLTIDGDYSVTEYWWFSYDNNILVKSESTESASLTCTTVLASPDDEYIMDVSSTTVLTLK